MPGQAEFKKYPCLRFVPFWAEMRLSESRIFHNAIGIKNKYRSAIYQEMRDAEFVLRFFTFKDDWEVFTGGVRRRMDSFMSANRNPDDRTLSAFRQSFQDTLGVVTSVFGDHAFHRWKPERHVWRNQVFELDPENETGG